MTAYMPSASCREIHFTMVTPYWIAQQKYQQIHKYKTTDLLRSRQSWWNMPATVKFCWTSAHHWVRTVTHQQNATEYNSAIHKHTVQQQQTVQPLLHNSLKRTVTWESIKCQYPSRHLKCNNFHVPTLHNEAYILTTALLNKSATVLRRKSYKAQRMSDFADHTKSSPLYASPHLRNQLPSSFHQPHCVHSPPGSPHPAHITSSQLPASLSSPITVSAFHSRLKTHLFHKSFPP